LRCIAGYDIILNTTGRDATEDFEEIGHSNAAREMLDKYLVGDFEVTPKPVGPLSHAVQRLKDAPPVTDGQFC
jgi:cytochrome b involved in lipid metabolism